MKGNNLQGIFPLTLGAIRVDRGTRETHVVEIIIQEVCLGLGIHKNQCTRRRHSQKQVIEALLLKRRFSIDDLGKCTVSRFLKSSAMHAYILVNVGVSAARPPDAHTDMVFCKVIARQLTAILVESGRKHHVAVVSILIDVLKSSVYRNAYILGNHLPPPDMILAKSDSQSDCRSSSASSMIVYLRLC